MEKRSRSEQSGSLRERSMPGEVANYTPSPTAEVNTPGTLSLALPLVVALAVLAILVMANVLVGQPATGDERAATPAVLATITSEGRGDQ